MLVDGKAIAQEIYLETKTVVSSCEEQPRMAVITCAPNFETKKYLSLKKRKAEEVGIALALIELPETATTEDVKDSIMSVMESSHGIVVQLPLPKHIDREEVLSAIPAEKDPDCFSNKDLLPPVVGAIDVIANTHAQTFNGKKVVVIGSGRLVGAPAIEYAKSKGGEVIVLTEASTDTASVLEAADIIISGAGKADLIQPEDVKTGVAIYDAGTSEDGGELRGDVAKAVAGKASLFTPVPGGIGPITVAVLMRNLAALAASSRE